MFAHQPIEVIWESLMDGNLARRPDLATVVGHAALALAPEAQSLRAARERRPRLRVTGGRILVRLSQAPENAGGGDCA